jgi:predicted phosphoribosyltransferase
VVIFEVTGAVAVQVLRRVELHATVVAVTVLTTQVIQQLKQRVSTVDVYEIRDARRLSVNET